MCWTDASFVDVDNSIFAEPDLGLPLGGLLNSGASFAEAVLSRHIALSNSGLISSLPSACIMIDPLGCYFGFAEQLMPPVPVGSTDGAYPWGDY